jgi:hypothetical protein
MEDSNDFPIICESCLGINANIRMVYFNCFIEFIVFQTREQFGKECKVFIFQNLNSRLFILSDLHKTF